MKTTLGISLLAALALAAWAPAPTFAQAAVAIHAGTLGVGGSVAFGLTPSVNVRGTVGVVPSDPELEADDIDFTVEFPTLMRATVDLYPVAFFFVSGGILFVSRGGDTDVVGTFTGTQDFGGTTYSAAEVGNLTGTFSLSGTMPYLGIGFGNPVGRRVGLQLDLGVGFGSVPTVSLGATGPISTDPTFQADLRERESEIQDDIPKLLRYYPVASLALSFRLGG